MPSWLRKSVLGIILAATLAVPAAAPAATGALQYEDECSTLALAPSDDGSVLLPLGFTVRIGWQQFANAYLNNNGNITFGSLLAEFSPFVPSDLGRRIIAPFFADVDTRAGNGQVTWGSGMLIDGTRFFCATWREVGYYNTSGDKRNTFQAILSQSPEQAASSAMTITFNYDKIEWETGDASQGVDGFGGRSASAGWFDGIQVGATVPGSTVPGSLLDSNPETGLVHQVHEGQAGRIQWDYSYNASYPATGVMLDLLTADTSLPVEVCAIDGDTCFWKRSYSGEPRFRAVVPPGTYRIVAFPQASSQRTVGMIETPPLSSGNVLSVALPLGPTLDAPAAEITVAGARHTPAGIPSLTTSEPISIALPTCSEESGATVEFARSIEAVTHYAPMSPDDGFTSATLPPGSLEAGEYVVTIERGCADGAESITFGLSVTPTVVILDQYERPLADAKVTLLRAEHEGEPLELLDPDTDFLTPGSRFNPAQTSTGGLAGWNMRMGSYQVQATAEACVDPDNHDQDEVRSARFNVDLNNPAPDPITLTMFCPNAVPPVEPPADPAGPEVPDSPAPPVVDPPRSTAPTVSFRLGSRCVRPYTRGRRGARRASVPLYASLQVSGRAQVELLVERRAIAPRRFRCRNVVRPPLRRSAFRRVGRVTRTLNGGRYRLILPVGARRARSSKAKSLRLPLQRLRPGTYRITATATDEHGRSMPVRTHFIVLAPRVGGNRIPK